MSEYDHEASIMRRPWPTGGFCAMGKKRVGHHYRPRSQRMTAFGNEIKIMRKEASVTKRYGLFPISAWWLRVRRGRGGAGKVKALSG